SSVQSHLSNVFIILKTLSEKHLSFHYTENIAQKAPIVFIINKIPAPTSLPALKSRPRPTKNLTSGPRNFFPLLLG
ncbi:MAG: hypothetical protein WCR52_24445, partial [Bacteroidota bacterium]